MIHFSQSNHWADKLLFIVPTGKNITANYAANGTWWAVYEFADYGDYQVNATYNGDLNNVTINNATISISKTPTNITIENTTVNLFVLDSIVSGATLTPADAGNLTFTSSNSSVAKVENGKIIALDEGAAVITVSFAGDDDYAAAENKTIEVTVSKIPTEIIINTTSLDLITGDETVIVANLTPADAGNVTFTSSDEDVVYVDNQGNVIAQGKGQAIITLSFAGNNKYKAAENRTITVTVSPADASVTVDNNTLDLKVGETYAINATRHPDTILLDITYTSSNSSVATVNENGIVTAVGEGTAIITVEVGDDEFYAINSTNVTVTVSKVPTEIILLNDTLNLIALFNLTFGDATLNPAEAGDLTYTSSNSSVVMVLGNLFIPLTQGNAVITVSFNGNDKYAAAENKTIDVTVSLHDSIVTVDNSALNLKVAEFNKINAAVEPEILKLLIRYTSSNESVAVVDEFGQVVAMGEGNAVITVSIGDGIVFAKNSTQVLVTVSLRDATINVNNSTLDLTVNDTFDLVATTVPEILHVTYVVDNSGVVSVDENGKVTALKTGKAVITVKIAPNGVFAENSTKVTVNVKGIPTEITASAITTVYNVNKDLVITLKDANGKPISGVNITVDLNGAKTYTTDAKGQVKVSTKGLAPEAYTAKVTFNGNSIYAKSTKNVKVTVKKATPKIAAKAKTFKTTTKTKKYTITLKDNTGKAIRNAKVTLKVNGKTYKATTNSKGKATFKITKLNKKGTFKATITYKGNTYYNKATKKVTIKVKSVWKTVSKGSKNSAIVKKIQRALKNHGYYLEYNGHYLMVDGIYWDYTEMAVKEFQNDNVLKVTGKVDEKTAKKLGII